MDRQEIKSLLNYLENNRENLNSLHRELLASLKEHYTATMFLTKRQVEYLYEMKEYITSPGLEEAVYESESLKYQAQYSSFDHLTSFRI
jgi:hypothetical protein